jgi:hypothetical protein
MGIFVSMPKNLAWTQQRGGLNVTIMSKVVVYAPAEITDKLPLVLLYPFLLCGFIVLISVKGVVILNSRNSLFKFSGKSIV